MRGDFRHVEAMGLLLDWMRKQQSNESVRLTTNRVVDLMLGGETTFGKAVALLPELGLDGMANVVQASIIGSGTHCLFSHIYEWRKQWSSKHQRFGGEDVVATMYYGLGLGFFRGLHYLVKNHINLITLAGDESLLGNPTSLIFDLATNQEQHKATRYNGAPEKWDGQIGQAIKGLGASGGRGWIVPVLLRVHNEDLLEPLQEFRHQTMNITIIEQMFYAAISGLPLEDQLRIAAGHCTKPSG